MKFLADRNLGKLTKWLRILGYDTACHTGNIDRGFLKRGVQEGRIVLTRRRDMAERNFSGRMFIVHSDNVTEQIKEIIDTFSLQLDPQKFFTICLDCNEPIQTIQKADVKEKVPQYVFKMQDHFQICPHCRKLYWPGTHKDNVLSYLKQHNLIHHP